jgi:hypothetical protein
LSVIDIAAGFWQAILRPGQERFNVVLLSFVLLLPG